MIYPDSSFLILLYSPDANTVRAAEAARAAAGMLVITPLVAFEIASALQLRVFRLQISEREAAGSLRKFELNLEAGAFRLVELPDGLFVRAREIAEQTTSTLGTRALDLLHVAAAIELGADSLYSFDDRQRRLAKKLRLKLNRFG